MARFTDLTIRSLPEGLHFDERTPGFGIRVGKNRRTWLVVKQPNRTKVRLGHYPDISLQEARRRALVRLGSPLEPKAAPLFLEALDAFLGQERWKESTKRAMTWSLKRHFKWRKPLDTITHEDVAQVLDGIDAPSERAHAFSYLRIFFNWCIPRYISQNPTKGYSVQASAPRQRVLSPEELKRVWVASEQMGTFGVIIKLLILTGQRRSEIAALQAAWITEDRITLPSWITKNKREHTFPIGAVCVRNITQAWPNLKNTSDAPLLLSARGKSTSFSGWSKSKAKLDKLSGVTDWTLHDLRRTFATNLAALGTPIHVTEKLLNHVSGTTGGLVSVYQLHEYWDEQVAAMTAWENRLQSLLSPVT